MVLGRNTNNNVLIQSASSKPILLGAAGRLHRDDTAGAVTEASVLQRGYGRNENTGEDTGWEVFRLENWGPGCQAETTVHGLNWILPKACVLNTWSPDQDITGMWYNLYQMGPSRRDFSNGDAPLERMLRPWPCSPFSRLP